MVSNTVNLSLDPFDDAKLLLPHGHLSSYVEFYRLLSSCWAWKLQKFGHPPKNAYICTINQTCI